MKIAIIGTAGRVDPPTVEEYNLMYSKLENILSRYSNVHLVSGGAAYSDHLAVKYFLNNKNCNLTLYLPSKFSTQTRKYIETNKFRCTGKTSNLWHNKFKENTGINSLDEIANAIKKGCIVIESNNSFYQRNNRIADGSDELIAFTRCNQPEYGGTKYTWKRFSDKKKKVCININNLNKP